MIIAKAPEQFIAAFNPIPVSIQCNTNDETKENYVVNTNIVYDYNRIVSITASSENTAIIELLLDNIYVVGDNLFIDDTSTTNLIYTGYYTVLEVIDDFHIKIDLTLSVPYTESNKAYTYRYIKYTMEPNPSNFVELDIHNTIKDFVGTSIIDNGSTVSQAYIYGRESFKYGLIFGEEYNFVYNFYDNGNIGGNVVFLNNVYTNVNQVPFQIGDSIVITQDPQEWDYTDNFFSSGYLGFTNGTSTDGHNFQPGDTVFVTGQSTYPSSNGAFKVVSAPDIYTLVVDKTFPGSTVAEGGKIYGNPTPQYDGVAKITNIYYDAGIPAMVIVTDKIHNETTQPIGGTIRLTNNKKIGTLNALKSGITYNEGATPVVPIFNFASLCRFDNTHFARFNVLNYSNLLKDKFISSNNSKLWSTILRQDEAGKPIYWNNITKDSPGFILLRQNPYSPVIETFRYTYYDKQKNVLGQFYDSYIQIGESNNYYATISLEYILYLGGYNDIGAGDLYNSYNDIYYFDIEGYNITSSTPVSTKIRFAIDQECSGLPTYHLTWLDSFGSYITYPFKYNATQSTDVKRNNYYRGENEWNYIESGGLVGGYYTTTNTHRGENTYNVQARTKLQLTSGWLNDNENIVFEDLMKSADVYISTKEVNMEKDENLYLKMYSAQLESNNIEYKTNYAGDFIFNYSPIVRFAFNDYRYNNWNTTVTPPLEV